MRKLASRLVRGDGIKQALAPVAVLLVAAAALAVPSMASAATPTLQVSAAYQTTPESTAVNVGNTFDLVYTIANANSTTSSTGVGVSDTLPSGIVLDSPPSETPKSCATGDQSTTNVAGGSQITITGVGVAPATSCTISFAVVASAPLAPDATVDSLLSITSDGTLGTTANTFFSVAAAKGISVYADPTVTLTPSSSATKFKLGAFVDLSFSAAPGAGDTIPAGNLQASDDQGNAFTSGQAINTSIPGEHQVTVYAVSAAGGYAQAVYTYTVESPSLTKVKTSKKGIVSFDVKYPAAGSLLAEALDGKTVVAKVTKKVTAGKNTAFSLTLTAAGKKLLAKHPKGIKVKLTVLYTAANFDYVGSQPTITKSGIKLT